MRQAALVLILAGASVSLAAQMPKYGVTVTADKGTDFSKFKTYAWEHGWQAHDKGVDADIRAAVDRELAAVGLVKKADGPGDLIVTYGSLRRIDVDVHADEDAKGARPQYDVGTLVILLLEPGSRKELFRARVDTPMQNDREHVKTIVDKAVADMFAKYPTRVKK